jgi:hypothetical protein
VKVIVDGEQEEGNRTGVACRCVMSGNQISVVVVVSAIVSDIALVEYEMVICIDDEGAIESKNGVASDYEIFLGKSTDLSVMASVVSHVDLDLDTVCRHPFAILISTPTSTSTSTWIYCTIGTVRPAVSYLDREKPTCLEVTAWVLSPPPPQIHPH